MIELHCTWVAMQRTVLHKRAGRRESWYLWSASSWADSRLVIAWRGTAWWGWGLWVVCCWVLRPSASSLWALAAITQLCLTLCNLMNWSPPGCSVHGISQARTLEWVPFHPPGDLPDPGIELVSPAWQADSLPAEPPGKLLEHLVSPKFAETLWSDAGMERHWIS